MATFDIADKLESDLKQIDINIHIIQKFEIFLKSNSETHKFNFITLDDDNKIMYINNYERSQYISTIRRYEYIKTYLFGLIKWSIKKTKKHSLLSEVRWTSNNTNQISFYVYGYENLKSIKKFVQTWVIDNDYIVDFNLISVEESPYYVTQVERKYWWQKEFKKI